MSDVYCQTVCVFGICGDNIQCAVMYRRRFTPLITVLVYSSFTFAVSFGLVSEWNRERTFVGYDGLEQCELRNKRLSVVALPKFTNSLQCTFLCTSHNIYAHVYPHIHTRWKSFRWVWIWIVLKRGCIRFQMSCVEVFLFWPSETLSHSHRRRGECKIEDVC